MRRFLSLAFLGLLGAFLLISGIRTCDKIRERQQLADEYRLDQAELDR